MEYIEQPLQSEPVKAQMLVSINIFVAKTCFWNYIFFRLCCECGIVIEPNPANMCVGCLRSQVDITEGIPKQATLHFCRGCERYLQPPGEWVQCALESRELLSLCLKKLKGLNRVKLIDASFLWTEPHSKRIKVLTLFYWKILISFSPKVGFFLTIFWSFLAKIDCSWRGCWWCNVATGFCCWIYNRTSDVWWMSQNGGTRFLESICSSQTKGRKQENFLLFGATYFETQSPRKYIRN